MFNLHTKFTMCALPVATAGDVVAGVYGGPIDAPRLARSLAIGTARRIRKTR
ncbi:MAG: hypothetical protein LH481_11920 [Burkholderiales bacterium]|nr:hypothetical protein [Burkholderiales bacterium]